MRRRKNILNSWSSTRWPPISFIWPEVYSLIRRLHTLLKPRLDHDPALNYSMKQRNWFHWQQVSVNLIPWRLWIEVWIWSDVSKLTLQSWHVHGTRRSRTGGIRAQWCPYHGSLLHSSTHGTGNADRDIFNSLFSLLLQVKKETSKSVFRPTKPFCVWTQISNQMCEQTLGSVSIILGWSRKRELHLKGLWSRYFRFGKLSLAQDPQNVDALALLSILEMNVSKNTSLSKESVIKHRKSATHYIMKAFQLNNKNPIVALEMAKRFFEKAQYSKVCIWKKVIYEWYRPWF